MALSNAAWNGSMASAHELGVVVRLIHRCRKMS
jgi:hypothetical protein